MGMCSDPELKKNMKRSCVQFNLDASNDQIHNKIMIGDMCRCSAARGQEIVLENTQI